MSNSLEKLIQSTSEDEAIEIIKQYADARGIPDLSYVIIARAFLRMYSDSVIKIMGEIKKRTITIPEKGEIQ